MTALARKADPAPDPFQADFAANAARLPGAGLAWLDVGCGNGAFTDILVRRMSPRAVAGLDPSPAQLSFARERFAAGVAEFHQGDAMAMPFHTAAFDVAVMPLVLFFVPVPAKGVAEMARVVRPGGHVAAYAWDMDGGGFPYASLMSELKALAVAVPEPRSEEHTSELQSH